MAEWNQKEHKGYSKSHLYAEFVSSHEQSHYDQITNSEQKFETDMNCYVLLLERKHIWTVNTMMSTGHHYRGKYSLRK